VDKFAIITAVKTRSGEGPVSLKNNFDVVVIGAGPAGLMGAIECHSKGISILVVEQMYRPALKLRITGSGRCNITNSCDRETFMKEFGRSGKFLRQAFSRFFSGELLKFFNDLGVEFELERGGRYFPENGKAETVAEALIRRNEVLGTTLLSDKKVVAVEKAGDSGFNVLLSARGTKKGDSDITVVTAKKILLATGGRSYPATGSDGSGFELAKSLGHTIIKLIPALVPLKGEGPVPAALSGLAIKNCRVSVFNGDRKLEEKFGDIEFRDSEIAGPLILAMSEMIVREVKSGGRISIVIDMKPSLDHKKLDLRILRETESRSNRTFSDIMKKLLPGLAVNLFLDLSGIDPDKRPEQVTKDDRKMLRHLLKGLRIPVKGSVSIDKALVTAGGVSLKEIDPATMKSKITDGIYFAGEMIDLNGSTGGFNLQAAFSTGWVAGRSMRESLERTGG